ncbi:MAG: hypothetical protein IPJ65_08770 [Archangiaceae bacterium]|nr:hypothetical protein [Archangiaceae bacterium]
MSRLTYALVATLLPLAARADTLELLGPESTVSPDGFEIAVRLIDDQGKSLDARSVQLEVQGAAAGAGRADGLARLFTITPNGDRKVTLKATTARASAARTFSVGPPGARVALKLEPAAPVKNRDTSAELTIELRNADGQPDPESAPPVLRANVGTIENLEKVAPAVYRARYVLPTTRFPEVAVVVAFSAWPHPQSVHGAFGALRVPLAAAVELPGKTEANADLTLNIAGTPFGPVRTGPDGRFKIPIVVPPGYGMASGTAVDRLGNKRSNPIDLALPPTDQLACVVNPTQLPADGQSRARVLCATSDVYGKIATGAKVALAAQRGRASAPRALDNGVVEFTYVAPAELGSGREELSASWRQGAVSAHEGLQLTLVQGPAASAVVTTPEPFVHLGGSVPLQATVKDALDRPRTGARLALVSDVGALEEVKDLGGGKLTARWRVPDEAATGPSALAVRAWGPVGFEPARIACWVEGTRLLAAVTDLAGLPVPAQPLKVGPRDVTTDAEGVVELGPVSDTDLSLRHRAWPGLTADLHIRDGAKLVFPRSSRPGSAPASLKVTLAPKVPVVVRVEVKGRAVTWWVESSDGALLEGRPVDIEVTGGRAGPTSVASGRHHFEVQGLTAPGSVAVVDTQSQVFAVAEVRP